MAARTALVDIAAGTWSDELLAAFGVPRCALPEIVASDARHQALDGGLVLRASLADQAAGALSMLSPGEDAALVNFGTGAFVLLPAADATRRVPGFLTAPLGAGTAAGVVLEGTVNGAGPALDRCGPGPTAWPARDPCPGGFAIPDLAGIGAPHWRADLGFALSAPAAAESSASRRRVVMEGLLFRVREILEGLGGGRLPPVLRITGGLAADPGLGPGLAAVTGCRVERVEAREATLAGAGRLAAGLELRERGAASAVPPGPGWLAAKYPRWREWLAGRLAAS